MHSITVYKFSSVAVKLPLIQLRLTRETVFYTAITEHVSPKTLNEL